MTESKMRNSSATMMRSEGEGYTNGISNGNMNAFNGDGPSRRKPQLNDQNSVEILRTRRSSSYSSPTGVRVRSETVTSNGAGRGSKRAMRNSTDTVNWLKHLRDRVETQSLRAKLRTERIFRRHGRRIARHPVQTLLIACLMITSLFYPAVGIYLWSSKGGPGMTRGDTKSVWRSLSTPLLDSFASSGRKHHNSLRDLRMIWDDAPDLRAIDARDADAYIGSVGQWAHLREADTEVDNTNIGSSIRVEHVFVTTDDVIMGMGPRFGALHGPILQSALNLQRRIEAVIGESKSVGSGVPRCIRNPIDGQCLVLSPLSYWSMDREAVKGDLTPTETLLSSRLNHTEQGVPLTLSTTLAGRSHLFKQLPRADHLALTFFLEDDAGDAFTEPRTGITNPSHEAWSAMLKNITGQHVNLLHSDWQTPKELILQFTPRHPEESFPTQKVFLLVAYIAMFVWLTRSLSSIRNVHSPFGLAFTACVELVISMTLAVSICALVGVRLTLIPWETLPFVIVVIGSENMFALTNAIIATPTSLNVASRLATGFGEVGVPIAITVASDVSLMCTIALLVDVPAVREFCIFAIFALIVDFFMQMSFYATVLSIDIQRLELADLLSQDNKRDGDLFNGSKAKRGGSQEHDLLDSGSKSTSQTAKSFIATSCRTVWRARTARTASLSLLLAFMTGIYLYHGTGYTSSLSFPLAVQERERAAWNRPLPEVAAYQEEADANGFDPYAHLTPNSVHEDVRLPWWHASPSAQLWQSLNPRDSTTLRVKVEPWTVVALASATRQHVGKRNFASWAIFRPRVRAIIWFAKLVVLPIAGTTALLWVLLLYLLKDTELLASLQSTTFMDGEDEEDDMAWTTQGGAHPRQQLDVSLTLCGEGHGADVLFTAYGGDYVVSVSADASLHVVQMRRKTVKTDVIHLRHVVQPYSPPAALALDVESGCIAVGHRNGSMSVIELSDPQLIRNVHVPGDVSAVQLLKIVRSDLQSNGRFEVRILSFHANGLVTSWLCNTTTAPGILKEGNTASSWIALPVTRGMQESNDLVLQSSATGEYVLNQIRDGGRSLYTLASGRSRDGLIRSGTVISAGARVRLDSHLVLGTHLGIINVMEIATGRQAGRMLLTTGGVIHTMKSVSISGEREDDDRRKNVLLAFGSSKASVVFMSQSRYNSTNFYPGSPPPRSNGLPQESRSSMDSMSIVTETDSVLSADDSPTSDGIPIEPYALTLGYDMDTLRGGADVIKDGNEYHLIGFRRRGTQTDESNTRWEAVSLHLGNVLRSVNQMARHSMEDRALSTRLIRAALPLDALDIYGSTPSPEGPAASALMNPLRKRLELGANSSANTYVANALAFSRISNVQHYEVKESQQQASLLLTFGNAIAIAQIRKHKTRF